MPGLSINRKKPWKNIFRSQEASRTLAAKLARFQEAVYNDWRLCQKMSKFDVCPKMSNSDVWGFLCDPLLTMSTSNFYLVRVAIETSSPNLGNIYLPPVDQPAESAAGSSSWYVAGRMNCFSSGSKAWAALCHLCKCRIKYGEFKMLWLWESKSREIKWYSSPAWNVWVFGEVLPNSHHSSDVAMWGCNQRVSMPGMTKTIQEMGGFI